MKNKNEKQTWHERHIGQLTFGQRTADRVADGMGSWPFIIGQTVFVVIWMIMNIIGFLNHWDPYPFILLNLLFSTQAAYAAPIIMMAQNRQNERDRFHAQEDLATDRKAEREIKELQKSILRIEKTKLNKIISTLEEIKNK